LSLLEFERRAAIRHGWELQPLQLWDVEDVPVEDFKSCPNAGICSVAGITKKRLDTSAVLYYIDV
jgi:hypothetical protein